MKKDEHFGTVYGLPQVDVTGLESFIPEDEIFRLLGQPCNDKGRIRAIIEKSLDISRVAQCLCLEPEEMAALLNVTDPELIEEIEEAARTLKKKVYGNRIVLFAPLYIGNECINNCEYCGLRCSNKEVVRDTLTPSRLEQEIRALQSLGHKRLIEVFGEHPRYSPEFIAEVVRQTYGVKEGKGAIRRVNINAAPLDVEGFKTVNGNLSPRNL